VLELFLKVIGLRFTFAKSLWNWLDTVIVGGWCVEEAIGISTFLNPMMLRLVRLVKLLKVAKLFKSFKALDSLSIMIGSLKASVSVMFWSISLIVWMQLGVAILFCQVLEPFITDESNDPEKVRRVYEYFGTFTRSWLSLCEITLGNWAPVCRLLTENVSELWFPVIMLYVLCISFGVMKVITACFIFETQKCAQSDQDILILEKERSAARLRENFIGVFKEIDDSGDGTVNWDEFQDLLHDNRVLTWLAALDLDLGHCQNLFSILDTGDGRISFQEFVSGVQRVKGPAKAVDLVFMHEHLLKVEKDVSRLVGNNTQ
jgi:hypothetical protein